MDKELLASLRAKSREERMAYFNEHKTELLDDALSSASGGEFDPSIRNTESNVPDAGGYFYSSWEFICYGEKICS
jgi:hypothetical protein